MIKSIKSHFKKHIYMYMALHIHVYTHLEVTTSSVILKHLNIKCGVFLMGFFINVIIRV